MNRLPLRYPNFQLFQAKTMAKNRIKELRSDKGLTQNDLTELIGCTKQYVQRIEDGHENSGLKNQKETVE
jgi:transcriptional regulator with XRE-family HTH domain